MKNFRDIVEDTLIRLEEFQSIVTMVSENPDRIQMVLIHILNTYCSERWRMAVQSAYSSNFQNYNI